MSDKKVKIANILGSQIPDFIQADNPLFREFLTQYYESEEHEYGTTYLAEHISSLKKISTVSDISLVEYLVIMFSPKYIQIFVIYKEYHNLVISNRYTSSSLLNHCNYL